jgi:hypothetical protein
MGEIRPRSFIPLEWGKKTCCPLCSDSGMSVLHQADMPDQLSCRRCGFSFELDTTGEHLYVTHWPPSISARAGSAGLLWLTVGELKSFARQIDQAGNDPIPGPSSAQALPLEILSDDEDQNRQGPQEESDSPVLPPGGKRLPPPDLPDLQVFIRNMRALGNSYDKISLILEQRASSPSQRENALEACREMERQEHGRQQKKLVFSVLAVLLVFLVAGMAVFVYPGILIHPASPVSPSSSEDAATLQANAAPSDLPALIKVLKLATPVVHRYPTLSASEPAAGNMCPMTAEQAAGMFGGEAEYWRSLSGGWIMMNQLNPSTITVPNGMKAAYLVVGKGISLAEVQGPAKMENVYYVSISCQ